MHALKRHLARIVSSEQVCSTSYTQQTFKLAAGQRQGRVHRSSKRQSTGQVGGNIEPPDVRRLAKLAQISVTDEEVRDWEPKLKEIVGWFDQLQKIDVEGVPPCTRSDLSSLLAAGQDIPREFDNRDALMDSVPEREGPFVKVPKIL